MCTLALIHTELAYMKLQGTHLQHMLVPITLYVQYSFGSAAEHRQRAFGRRAEGRYRKPGMSAGREIYTLKLLISPPQTEMISKHEALARGLGGMRCLAIAEPIHLVIRRILQSFPPCWSHLPKCQATIAAAFNHSVLK